MSKFIVNTPNDKHKSGVLFINENQNKKYKSFLDKINQSCEVKKFNGDDSYNFTDIKTFLHKVKEGFESKFQNLASYDDLKSDFRIIIPWQMHRNEVKELENDDFEFKEHSCITKQDIQNNQ